MKLFEKLFPGIKVQKISINAGFSCPNRDGTIGKGGCIYCDNSSFTPAYCLTGDTVEQQITKGKEFFSRKYPEMKYLAYFQSFTSTYTSSLTDLKNLYSSALASDDIVGLVIGTRPDTFTSEIAQILGEINRTHPVIVEIGAETSHDRTLSLINRHHTWGAVCDAVELAKENGLHVGLHLIAGLPGETEEDILTTIEKVCDLGIDSLKIHQLQIIKGTPLHILWKRGDIAINPFSLEEYLDLCVKIVNQINGRVEIERFTAQAPPGSVIAPSWGIKNYQFTDMLKKRLKTCE